MGFNAYIDESGTHRAAAALSVAITVAESSEWRSFEKQWGSKIANLTRGYHAKRFPRLHAELADLMLQHTAFSSFITLLEADYHRHFPKWVQSVLGGPYARAVLISIMSAAVWSRENNAGRITYFIEQGHREFAHVSTLMNVIRRTEENRELFAMEDWAPATKNDLPIHCPDTVSHHASEHYGTGSYGPFLDQLYDGGKLWRGNFPDALFQENSEGFKEAALLALRGMKKDRNRRKWVRRQSKIDNAEK